MFSGGKDSTFSLYLAKKRGLSIKCLLALKPKSPDSYFFHYPNIWITELQSQVLQIPIFMKPINSTSIIDEYSELEELIRKAKIEYKLEGIIHGGINSNFQKNKFSEICQKYNLKLISPLWQVDQYHYMQDLLTNNFVIEIVGVSAMGLDYSWLGVILNHSNLQTLSILSKKFKFNLSFEGGEAETLVLDCPIFSKKLKILNSKTNWDGQRGMVEIYDALLIDK